MPTARPFPRRISTSSSWSNGYSFAVRGSGTEPKIKFYVFGRSDVTEPEQLAGVKLEAAQVMDSLLAAIDADARARAERD